MLLCAQYLVTKFQDLFFPSLKMLIAKHFFLKKMSFINAKILLQLINLY